MAKRTVIKATDGFEGALIGLVAQIKDYQLCWNLNRILNYDLKRMNDIEIIYRKKNKTALFSLYRFEDELDKCVVNLISNKYFGEYLIPEIKQADFFFMIHGEISDQRKADVEAALKMVSAIQLMIPVDYPRLRSRQNLIFE